MMALSICFSAPAIAGGNATLDQLKSEVAEDFQFENDRFVTKVELDCADPNFGSNPLFFGSVLLCGVVTYEENGTVFTQAIVVAADPLEGRVAVEEIGEQHRLGRATSTTGGGGLGTNANPANGTTNASIEKVVVGYMDAGPFTPYHAFRYDGGTETLLDLGALGPASTTESFARGVSRDGSVVVGISGTSDPNVRHAFRWTEAGGMVDLGTGPPGFEKTSRAFAISGDGNKIVGTRSFKEDELGFLQTKAFLCTFTDGACTFQDLTDGVATAVTDDGSVIAGQRTLSNAFTAFRWTSAGGVQNIGTLAGHSRSAATDISNNGKVVTRISIEVARDQPVKPAKTLAFDGRVAIVDQYR